MHNPLQYISQGQNATQQLDAIASALDAGCTWIQLRFKNANETEFGELAEQVKKQCQQYKATFIVNDQVVIARQTEADGVHLGLDDMPVAKAREILGDSKIIGGTANTLADVLQRVSERCDYVGLGPFRFTTTKAKLSPVLGLEGYAQIMNGLQQQQQSIPVYAIGGILEEDVPALMATGVHGIALSGLITQHAHKAGLIQRLNQHLHVSA